MNQWETIKGHIAQAILGKLEYRGFWDAGKYLDDDIADAIKPFFDAQRETLAESVEGLKEEGGELSDFRNKVLTDAAAHIRKQ